jgi:hypothetical protein
MRKFVNHFVLCLLTSVGLCFSAGCQTSSVVGDAQWRPAYVEQFALNAPTDSSWAAIKAEAKRTPGVKILVDSEADHVLTWTETFHTANPKDPLTAAETAEVGAGGFAVTSISLWTASGRSWIQISRVYYGPTENPTISASRGFYELAFYQRVCDRLGIEPKL